MTIRAIVADDERLARNRLQRLLSEIEVDVIGEASTGQQAIELVQAHTVDVLFLDINMPKKNGLEAAEYISKHIKSPPSIVFTTAYDEYALQAFKANASAYLLKPINLDELSKVIVQAGRLNQLHLNAIKHTVESLKLTVPKTSNAESLAIGSGDSIENIAIEDIIYFQSIEKHVFAVIKNRGEVLISYTLKDLQFKLAGKFIRIHRSALVNKSSMTKLSRSDDARSYLHLEGILEPLQVSRRHLSEVKKCFQ